MRLLLRSHAQGVVSVAVAVAALVVLRTSAQSTPAATGSDSNSDSTTSAATPESCSSSANGELIMYNSNTRCGISGVPSTTVSLDTCCGNVATAPTDDIRRFLQGVTQDATCRSVRLNDAYCGACEAEDLTEADQVLIELEMLVEDASAECCQTCSCSGDPDCSSFDGTQQSWIVCDGRREDNCQMNKKRCRKQLDHKGNKCQWSKKKTDVWQGWAVDGSPCQADWELSGFPEMTMYESEEVKVVLVLFERGVIKQARVETPEGIYTLDSDACFANDPRNVDAAQVASAWTVEATGAAGASEPAGLPAAWTVSAPNDLEILWHVAQAGAFVDIACTRPAAARTRLDVQALYTTSATRSADEGGFCVSGQLDRGLSTTATDDDAAFNAKCLSLNVPPLVHTCKAVASKLCNPANVAFYQRYWCEHADLEHTPAAGSAEVCVAQLAQGSDAARAERWATYLCELNLVVDVEECVALVGQFGYVEFLSKYSDGLVDAGNDVASCASSIADYGTLADTTCALGVSVEYLADGEWEQLFFVPAALPPCDGQLLADATQAPELFMHEVRFRQCSLSATCLVENACAPTLGLTVGITFVSACDEVLQRPDCYTCPFNDDVATDPQQVCESAELTPIGECDSCCLYDSLLGAASLGGPDPDPVDGEEDVDEESDDGVCRELIVQRPFCDEAIAAHAPLCAALPSNGGVLTISVEMNQTQLSCCKDCSAWGDPLIRSFGDVESKLISCDGRNAKCALKQGICEEQRDHMGHACKWDKAVDKAIVRNADIGAYGSPCRADWTLSGFPEFVMYQTEQFAATITNGERSVITKLKLDVSGGSYELDPAACFEEDPFAAWTVLGGAELASGQGLRVAPEAVDEREHERQWTIVDPTTLIFMRVICIQSESSTGDVGGRRLNIEALIDTDVERAESDDVAGFCIDGALDPGDATVNAFGKGCQEQVETVIDICRSLVIGTCNAGNLRSNVRQWCETANLFADSATPAADCYDLINPKQKKTAKVAARWVAAYCEAISALRDVGVSSTSWTEFCVSRVQNNGIRDMVADFGKGTISSSIASVYCGSSVADYKKRADSSPCMPGIEVMVKSGDDDDYYYEELFFIPANKPLCGNTLEVTAQQMPELFTKPFKFRQCLVHESCAVDALCSPTQGFEVAYKFRHDEALCAASR